MSCCTPPTRCAPTPRRPTETSRSTSSWSSRNLTSPVPPPTRRDCRYQAAIVQDRAVLLLRVRDPYSGKTFWLIPGGGREAPECEEDCVVREVREETHLEVEVVRLLWEEAVTGDAIYRRTKTYLCRRIGGSERPGTEPELEEHEHHVIENLAWFPLDRPDLWGPEIDDDPITSATLTRLRESLGLPPPGGAPLSLG